MLDNCLEPGKNEVQNLRDLQTKSSHFVLIELKDSGKSLFQTRLIDVPCISKFDIRFFYLVMMQIQFEINNEIGLRTGVTSGK